MPCAKKNSASSQHTTTCRKTSKKQKKREAKFFFYYHTHGYTSNFTHNSRNCRKLGEGYNYDTIPTNTIGDNQHNKEKNEHKQEGRLGER